MKKETQKDHQRCWKKTRQVFCHESQDDSLSCLSLNLKKNREGRVEQEIILTSHFFEKKKSCNEVELMQNIQQQLLGLLLILAKI